MPAAPHRPMVLARGAALAAAAVLALGVLAAAPAAAQSPADPAPPTLLVGAGGRFCVDPRFATIPEAVAAAPAGATIRVCRGVYRDTAVIDKPLTLLGAQEGVDARTGRPNLRTESIIDAPVGGIVIAPGVTGVTIDGFMIRNGGGGAVDGIDASGGTGGLTLVNNLIAQAIDGITLDADGAAPSTVAGNRMVGNVTGIRLTGSGAGTSVRDNAVELSTEIGVRLEASTAGVAVTGNQVSGSGVVDCLDDSVGTGTAGTANTWTGNAGSLSSPAGLCAPS